MWILLWAILGICRAENQLWPDLSIPVTLQPVAENQVDPALDAALIISIEDYVHLPNLPNADKNGRDWHRYFKRSRKLPTERIFWLDDTKATAMQIRKTAHKLTKIVQENGLIWVVFIGHGLPSYDGPRLLAVGAEPGSQNAAHTILLHQLLGYFSQGKQRHTVVVLDASFQTSDKKSKKSQQVPALRFQASSQLTVMVDPKAERAATILPGAMRPGLSYLLLGALRGWATTDETGVIRSKAVVEYARRAFRESSTLQPVLNPQLIGSETLDLGRPIAEAGPNLQAIRSRIDPLTEAKSRWSVQVNLGDGRHRDYVQLAQQAQSKVEQRLFQQAQEKARRKMLEETAEKLRQDAAAGWKAMAAARRIGGPEIFRLVQQYVTDYERAEVVIDGVKKQVTIPQVVAAKQWLEKKGRILASVMGYEMRLISANRFVMGSSEQEKGRNTDEISHKVFLSQDYYIGRYEVTQELWEAVMFSNPSQFRSCGKQCPVDSVSWCDALIFANRLSKREGFTPVYSFPKDFTSNLPAARCDVLARQVSMNRGANGYRLPTEAEWEAAARAGGKERYAGSDVLTAVAWYRENSRLKPRLIGQKQANRWELHDMSGNVWEMVWDWFGKYTPGETLDPYGPASGVMRVIRGGSWGTEAQMLRVANRYYITPGARLQDVGLRLVRNAK